MNRLSIEKRTQILKLLTEGMSIRATSRVTGASKNTISKLLLDVGTACREYQDKALRDLPCKRVEVDEIWAFCYAKEKNVPEEKRGVLGYGDVWTWTALCADTKLVPAWALGWRDAETARLFMWDVAERMAGRIQLTSDGNVLYPEAVRSAFANNVDYSMLVKIYGMPEGAERRYSAPECIGARHERITGNPDLEAASTSYVERQNLTMRMHMRRFTRLTNGFSKKIENMEAAVSLHFMFYNFAKIHKSLRVTPAMEAGVTNHVWEMAEIAALAN